jgi:hypothetical protein
MGFNAFVLGSTIRILFGKICCEMIERYINFSNILLSRRIIGGYGQRAKWGSEWDRKD